MSRESCEEESTAGRSGRIENEQAYAVNTAENQEPSSIRKQGFRDERCESPAAEPYGARAQPCAVTPQAPKKEPDRMAGLFESQETEGYLFSARSWGNTGR